MIAVADCVCPPRGRQGKPASVPGSFVMRISSSSISAASAILLVGLSSSPALAENDGITPESYADMAYGAEPNRRRPPGAGAAASRYTSSAYPQSGAGAETYQSANGFASEKLPDSDSTFSVDEITDAGHRFFGKVSIGFAKAVEYAFQRSGRPNGYILGEEAGGAFVAGLRYGEGVLYTKDAGQHRIFWQGPSVGYDFGAAGSKTMVLVYNLRSPGQIYNSFAGVDGSAYFIGGVGVTYLARDELVLAPIRSGVGLRLGANIGYLKYTRQPTWNPF
jgi:hypothetical protein